MSSYKGKFKTVIDVGTNEVMEKLEKAKEIFLYNYAHFSLY